jgi:hypothetical protein
LKWRIPSLQPGTALYVPSIPAGKEADYSFSFGINLLYSGDQISTALNYWMSGPRYYNVNDLLADSTKSIKGNVRTFHFEAPASQAVSVLMPPTGCLWVVNPEYAQSPIGVEDLPAYGKLTNQDRIL